MLDSGELNKDVLKARAQCVHGDKFQPIVLRIVPHSSEDAGRVIGVKPELISLFADFTDI